MDGFLCAVIDILHRLKHNRLYIQFNCMFKFTFDYVQHFQVGIKIKMDEINGNFL